MVDADEEDEEDEEAKRGPPGGILPLYKRFQAASTSGEGSCW